MFCYNCGYKINDDANFCPKCGTVLKNVTETRRETTVKKDNEILDRKALEIYLRDLLSLEFIVKKYKEEKENAERVFNKEVLRRGCYIKVYRLSQDDDWIKSEGNREHYLSFCYNDNGGENYKLMMEYDWESENYYPCALYVVGENDQWMSEYGSANQYKWINLTRKELDNLNKRSGWNSLKLLKEYGVLRIGRVNSEIDHAIRTFTKYYGHFCSECKQGLVENRKMVDKFEKDKEGISAELVKFERVLEKAYSINIIPQQYRNIYAIHYLSSFIDTSTESLSTAMLHLNLDSIINKLDKIIEQQKEIIINQRIQEAQNEMLLKQNQEYLKRLDRIERSTKSIADSAYSTSVYAKIAASNAEASALIGLANYLKR